MWDEQLVGCDVETRLMLGRRTVRLGIRGGKRGK